MHIFCYHLSGRHHRNHHHNHDIGSEPKDGVCMLVRTRMKNRVYVPILLPGCQAASAIPPLFFTYLHWKAEFNGLICRRIGNYKHDGGV